jgi:hypothetical protein
MATIAAPMPTCRSGGKVTSDRSSAWLPKISSPPTDRNGLDRLEAPDQYAFILDIVRRKPRLDERGLDAVALP